jgi:ankyrin repeat protein
LALTRVWVVCTLMIDRLLAADAEVNARNHDGCTPLHIAVIKGDKKMIDLLLANGADLKATNGDGNTPVTRLGCCVLKTR